MNHINTLHEYRLALAQYAEGHFDHGKRARETLMADLGNDWQRTLTEISTAFTERKKAERSGAPQKEVA